MKVVLLADVGSAEYHAGDEAMLDAAIEQLRQRGTDHITVISADPAATAARYDVASVGPIGFGPGAGPDGLGPTTEAERDQRLAAVLRHSQVDRSRHRVTEDDLLGLPAVLGAIDQADAVIVTGGGNLCSSWPEHLYERVAALSIACQRDVPAVVTSQTIGPDLSTRERELLAQSLSGTRLVGLREGASLDLAATILEPSAPRRLQLDDAIDLPAEPVPGFEGDERLSDGFVALTVDPSSLGPAADARLDQLAAFVGRIHADSELPVLFLPHVGRWTGDGVGDCMVGEALLHRLGAGRALLRAPLLPARQLAALTRQAAAIVTSRYHPLVFGLAAAVPCLAIYQDRYTAAKLTGALDHTGLGEWRVPVEAMATDLPGDLFEELWSRRDELTDHLSEVTEQWADRRRAHWDELWGAVTEPAVALPVGPLPVQATPATVSPKLAGLAALNTVATDYLERRATAQAAAVAMAGSDLRRATVEAENIQLLDEARHADLGAQAARALAAELRGDLDATRRRLADAQVVAGAAQAQAAEQDALVAAIHATKLMRWSRRPRAVYGRLRRLLRSGPS
jgi:polysaccharide pyruvyl transferase WcaK-like protein